jgi:hypothetical protein
VRRRVVAPLTITGFYTGISTRTNKHNTTTSRE